MNASESVFVREFTLAILRTIKESKVSGEQKQVINADLVPKFSDKFSGMNESVNLQIPKEAPKSPLQKLALATSTAIEIRNLVAPSLIHRPILVKPLAAKPLLQGPRAQIIPQNQTPQKNSFAIPAPSNFSPTKESYGKLDPLLRDASVSTIECSGAGQNLMIIRAGQKQFTKINLNPVEITQMLEKVAQEARIPLMDGIFKAAVDGFSVNAVISNVIGSRFIIKKQTPYSLLEG